MAPLCQQNNAQRFCLQYSGVPSLRLAEYLINGTQVARITDCILRCCRRQPASCWHAQPCRMHVVSTLPGCACFAFRSHNVRYVSDDIVTQLPKDRMI